MADRIIISRQPDRVVVAPSRTVVVAPPRDRIITGGRGLPGRNGDPGPPGDGAADPGDLTLIFDNKLI